MLDLLKRLYLLKGVYIGFGVIICLFVISFFVPVLYDLVWILLWLFLIAILSDIMALFLGNNKIVAERTLPERLSNGDENPIKIAVQNKYTFSIDCQIIDEIPFQFQKRDFTIKQRIKSNEKQNFQYALIPKKRGVYQFGKLNIFVNSPLKLVAKRYTFSDKQNLACYPSFIQMQKYDLIAFSKNKFAFGLKKIRKIGQTTEFEQIKEYVIGDDIRTINWKATAKRNELMVNQFLDENTENVYCILDKGRTMQMPFNGMTLLDYAINSTLALSNVIIKKNDRIGMMTFSNKVENKILAENKKSHLTKIIEQLYSIETNFKESDFGLIYNQIKYNITHRSLIILYTNFESLSNLNRQLKYLRAIAKSHLLLVVFFENTELTKLANKKALNTDHIFDKVIAEKFNFEKRLIVNELTKYGIMSVLTKPDELSINTINKYLEIKAKGKL
ncbi:MULTISPECIES: DUF58 domain-containing protein [Myroides]|uniref:DUF58 domain-containing protein n=1 Tax=Myroides albus TaxID=2562892 RepID=A0A6I3LLV7_9FLAO|nr:MULTISPECIES: DUF58 domain-containing protein [Myroides]MTG97152.1 DUF58 domain-containing protein [Myroides albus]MVX35149.1 DUF58 domain-containing protein [Myroides sp. LoEW2-1]UVD78894.1 DUF58 domain-containing protein [Myroides albus]